MSQDTKIEWTHLPGYRGVSWNPTRGCDKVSPGCKYCYVLRNGHRPWAKRYMKQMADGSFNWTGIVELMEHKVREPLSWRKPRCVFVNSTSDLFHESLPTEDIIRVLAVIAFASRHQFLVLTKRSGRMRELMTELARSIKPLEAAARAMGCTFNFDGIPLLSWPIPNLWLGVSVENQEAADERVTDLAETTAAVKFASYEPALGSVMPESFSGMDWIVAGDESGEKARPSDLAWYRNLIACVPEYGIRYFQKQITERGRKIPFNQWPEDLKVREWPEYRRAS